MKYKRLTKWEDDRTASINGSSPIDKDMTQAINRLAELEDKIENGTLIELPCKVGDKAYSSLSSKSVVEYEISEIEIQVDEDGIFYDIIAYGNKTRFEFIKEDIGDIVFLTRAEAEKRLKELKEEK